METQEQNEKEILGEYYSFLYELASKKNYVHASQLNDEEMQYCRKLLSKCKTAPNVKELYTPLMKNILKNHYGPAKG